MREDVLLVPAQLLGHEPRAATLLEDLRQRCGVTEDVGDPDDRAAHPEARLEVTLSDDELADDALAARQVHVGLDPHTTNGMPLAGGDLVPDRLEQRRVTTFDPVVLSGL